MRAALRVALFAMLALTPLAAAQLALPTLPVPDAASLLPMPIESPALPAPIVAPPILPTLPILRPLPRDDPAGLPALPRASSPVTLPTPAALPLDPPPGTTTPEIPPEVIDRLAVPPSVEPLGPPAPVTFALGATMLAFVSAIFSRAWRAAFAGPLVPLGSRFAKRARQEDAERARILAVLRERDGAGEADLAAAVELPRSSVSLHLHALEARGLVVARKESYHATGVRVDVDGPVLSQLQQRVLAILAERGPLTEHGLAALLEVGPHGASYHLRHLLATGHVSTREAEGETFWGLATRPTRAVA